MVFAYRTVASIIRMYFVYTLDMYRPASEFFGVNEALFSSSLTAMVFSILGAQPLTIVGITGLISLFSYTIFDIIVRESFGMYVGIIYITMESFAIFVYFIIFCISVVVLMAHHLVKGVEELVSEFSSRGSTDGYLSCTIAILYFATIYTLEKLGSSTIFIPSFRGFLEDYAYPAPVHTDSLNIYKIHTVIISTSDGEGAEVRRPIVKATAVVELRVSHFFMGLALIGTMSEPLLIVLRTMPAAVFAGVFFVVGWGSIESNGITEKIVFLWKENRFIQRDEPMLTVKRRKIALYVAIQLFGVLSCVAISQTIAAIVVLLPKWFTVTELAMMDDLTANNKVVLVSLGGAPVLPEGTEFEDYGRERKYEERKRGVTRPRTGSVHR
ncbi:hypothetical protein ACJ72_04699 [Emergomyces africanus]|uniref:Bicarbonate transporter-like transmembrane domain-containing protein n=1 Tax=Emergomyces africanus TaxID=1955775 RepID=A0A1B7NW38_9EURO|nr:hypothetical protein ACJ72_04699 [Emergomyces africanus]